MVETPRIEPCPWCGGQSMLLPSGDLGQLFRVACMEIMCSATGPDRKSNAAAIAAWNQVSRLRAYKALAEEMRPCLIEDCWDDIAARFDALAKEETDADAG